MVREFLLAIRLLAKRPGYAASIVITLALGIGATTLMFSVADAMLLRPLPFAEPERLVFLTGVAGPQRSPRGGSLPEIADWRRLNETLQDVSIYDETSLNLRIGSSVARVDAEMVSAGFFELLGAAPALGRTFRADEDAVPDRDAVAIISHGLWQERFGGDPAILERSFHLNDRAFAIVGVMPEDFAGLSFDTDVWIPSMMVTLTSAPSVVQDRGTRWLGAIGRLDDGVTVARAQEDLSRVAKLLEGRHPETNRERGVDVAAVGTALRGDTGNLVALLFGAVVLFLLVACANVAALQLASTASRRREMAVRVALGASRWHVLRQLLSESLALALAAGMAGTLTAAWALEGLISLMPAGALPRYVDPAIDPRAVLFALVVSLLGGLLVVIAPAMAATGHDLTEAIKEGARSAGPGLGSIRRPSTQQTLVVGEIALAMTLLAAAGLMIRSLERQIGVRLGFEPADVTVARLTLPSARYDPAARVQFAERLSARLREMPGVASAAIATSLPFTGRSSAGILVPEDAAGEDAAQRYFRHAVTPDFFATLAIPLQRGRTFTDQDRGSDARVAIINVSAARRLWGTDDVIGKRVRLGTLQGPAVEIVGTVGDARFRDITTNLTAPRVEPDVYFPFAQRPDRDLEIAVRTRRGAAPSLLELQQMVAAVDGSLPLFQVQRLEDAIRRQTATARFGSSLLSLFSGGALLLAAVGLYGLIAYVVGLSRKEIAIRLALGADARRVIGLILGNGLALVGIGLVIGIAGAIAAGRALQAYLFETSSIDALSLSAVASLLLAVTFVASLIPTRRAVRVDPQTALRAE